MPLTREIPCIHKTRKDLGRGLIVGSELIPEVDAEGKLQHTSLMLVLWENVASPSPSFQSPEDLVHAFDFDAEFEDEEESDDDNEVDETELIPEEEEDIEEQYVVDPEQGETTQPEVV